MLQYDICILIVLCGLLADLLIPPRCVIVFASFIILYCFAAFHFLMYRYDFVLIAFIFTFSNIVAFTNNLSDRIYIHVFKYHILFIIYQISVHASIIICVDIGIVIISQMFLLLICLLVFISSCVLFWIITHIDLLLFWIVSICFYFGLFRACLFVEILYLLRREFYCYNCEITALVLGEVVKLFS